MTKGEEECWPNGGAKWFWFEKRGKPKESSETKKKKKKKKGQPKENTGSKASGNAQSEGGTQLTKKGGAV